MASQSLIPGYDHTITASAGQMNYGHGTIDGEGDMDNMPDHVLKEVIMEENEEHDRGMSPRVSDGQPGMRSSKTSQVQMNSSRANVAKQDGIVSGSKPGSTVSLAEGPTGANATTHDGATRDPTKIASRNS